MPWDIRRGYRDCSGYAVVKESDGSIAGCHETREKAVRQIAALEASEADKAVQPEFAKYRGELYAMLTQEEKAFHDALVAIAQQYGPFDLGTSSIWVGYESAEDNEDAKIGVKCSNCSFFNPENNGCAILSYQVEPMGKCRLAAIPDALVIPDMDEEDEKEFVEEMMEGMNKKSPCWDGYRQEGMKPADDGSGRMVPNCVPIKQKSLWSNTAFSLTTNVDKTGNS